MPQDVIQTDTVLFVGQRRIVRGGRLEKDLQLTQDGIARKLSLERLLEMRTTLREVHLGHGHFPSFADRQRLAERGRKIVTVRGATVQHEIRIGLHRLFNDLPCSPHLLFSHVKPGRVGLRMGWVTPKSEPRWSDG